MLSIPVNRIISENPLHEKKRIEILILPARSIVEDADRRIDHLIIANHKQAWIENWLLQVKGLQLGGSWQVGEMLLNEIN